MDMKDACRIVQEYADLHTGGQILEAIKDMEFCYDDLDKEDRVAFNMFVSVGKRFFTELED
jgi:hypothetical protein